MNEDIVGDLYKKLSENGYNAATLGDSEYAFYDKMRDPDYRRKIYEKTARAGDVELFGLGTYAEYEKKYRNVGKDVSTMPEGYEKEHPLVQRQNTQQAPSKEPQPSRKQVANKDYYQSAVEAGAERYNNASDDEKRRMSGKYTDEEKAALREYRKAHPGAWATKDTAILRKWDERRAVESAEAEKKRKEEEETAALWKELEERPNEEGGYIPTQEEAQGLERTLKETRQTLKGTDKARQYVVDKNEQLKENSLRLPKTRYNPETGKSETVYVSKLGNETGNVFDLRKDEELYNELYGQTWDEQIADAESNLNGIRGGSREEESRHALTTPGYAAAQAGREKGYDSATVHFAQYHLDKAKEIQDIGERYKREGVGFLSGAGRGLKDTALDSRSWDFGLQDLAESAILKRAVNKEERGEELTSEEKALLDAVALEMAVKAEYSDVIGRGYKAGQVTGQSLEFMLEMLINPASGLGEATAKKLTGAVMRRYGRDLVERMGKNAARRVLTASAIAGREIGNVAGATLMTATTGLPATLADMNNRLTGDMRFEGGETRATGRLVYNPDGTVSTEEIDGGKRSKAAYSHVENKKDFGRALWEATASQAIERWSEFQGENLAPLMSGAGKLTRKAIEKIGLQSVNNWIDGLTASQFTKSMGDFLKRTQWHGTGGEFAEEIIGGIANAILVGDQTLDTNPETGVFNKDNLIDTFLGVALQGGFMATLNTAGYAMESAAVDAQIGRKEDWARSVWEENGNEGRFDKFSEALDGKAADVLKAVKGVLADRDLTSDEKREALELAGMTMRQRGMEKAYENLTRTADDVNTQTWNAIQDAADEGAALVGQPDENGQVVRDAEGIQEAFGLYNYAQSEVRALGGDELVSRLDENPQKAMQELRFTEADPAVMNVCMGYVRAKAVVSGMTSELARQASDALMAQKADVRKRAGDDGMLHHATMRNGENVDIVSEREGSDLVFVVGADGSTRAVSAGDIASRDNMEPVRNVLDAMDEQARTDAEAEWSQLLHPTLQFQPGDAYDIIGKDGNPVSVIVIGPSVSEDGQEEDFAVRVHYPDGQEENLNKDYLQNKSDEAVMTRVARDVSEERRQQLAGLMPAPAEEMETEPVTTEEQAEEARETKENSGETPESDEPGVNVSYGVGDTVRLVDGDGDVVEGKVQRIDNGNYVVETERPFDGRIVNEFSADQLGSMARAAEVAAGSGPLEASNPDEAERQSEAEAEQPQQSALSRIPPTPDGGYDFEKAENPGDVIDAFVELCDGNEAAARDAILQTIEGVNAELKAVQKEKMKPSANPMENIANQKRHAEAVEDAQRRADFWKSVEDEYTRREIAAEQGAEEEEPAVTQTEEAATQEPVNEEEPAETETPAETPVARRSEEESEGESETRGLSEEEARTLMSRMEESAEKIPRIQLTPENWNAEFGDEGTVETPVGRVKMGENQIAKLFEKGRSDQFGMIRPTLSSPQVIIEVPSSAVGGEQERGTSLLFVKSFINDEGKKVYYFKSVTVKKDGLEVSVSSHLERANRVRENLEKGKLIYRFDGGAQTEHLPADVSVTASPENSQGNVSGDKVTGNSANSKENGEKNARENAEESVREAIEKAEGETETEPTEAQKEAGNYKKGHVNVAGYDITIENPRDSVRRGTDAQGRPWETTMANTYGYIRGTEGVDGDHIDVFLANYMDDWDGKNVYVVDQYNPDGTFDEHKVMLGFNSADEARSAYLANYSEGWENGRRIDVSEVAKGEFDKWIESSHRKTKPFSEYKGVEKTVNGETEEAAEPEDAELAELRERLNLERERVVEYYLSGPKAEKLNRLRDNLKGKSMIVVGNIVQRHPSIVPADVAHEAWQGDSCTYLLRDLLAGKYGELPEGTRNPMERALKDMESIENDINALVKEGERKRAREIKKLEEAIKEREAAVTEGVSENEETPATTKTAEEKEGKETETGKNYSIEPAEYTKKNGKTLDMQLLKLNESLDAEALRRLSTEARRLKGWYDRAQGGFMMRSKEDAEALAKYHEEGQGGPSLQEVQETNGGKTGAVPVHQINVEGLFGDLKTKGHTKFSDHSTPVNEAAKEQDKAKEEQAKVEPKNEGQFGLVSDERMEELKRRLREKLRGRANMGIDPEMLSIGLELAAGYLDRGVKLFADFAGKMIEDLGDAVRPYLKAFYNGARDLPEVVESGLAGEMTPADEVSRFDVANFGRRSVGPLATAEHVVAEQEAARQTAQIEALMQNIRRYGLTGEVQLKDGRQGTVILVSRDAELDAVTGYKIAIDGKLTDVSPDEIDENKTIEAQPELLEGYGTGNGEYGEKEAGHDTAAVVREAEAVAVATERLIENAGTEEELNVVDEALQRQLEKVNDMLEVLDHYDVDPNSPDHEVYGKMKSAEKKAVRDARKLAKRIAKDLGVDQIYIENAIDSKRPAVRSNFAPIGGDVTIEVPLTDESVLKIYFDFANLGWDGNIGLKGVMLRTERYAMNGGGRIAKYGNNYFLNTGGRTIDEKKAPTYRDLLENARKAIGDADRGGLGGNAKEFGEYLQNIDRLLKREKAQKPAARKETQAKESEGAEAVVKPSYYKKVGLQTPVRQLKNDMTALANRLVEDLGQKDYAGPRTMVREHFKSSGFADDNVVATINIGNAGSGNLLHLTMRLGEEEPGGDIETGLKYNTQGGELEIVKEGTLRSKLVIPADVTYDELLKGIRREAAEWFPEYVEKEKGENVLRNTGNEVPSQVENDVDAPLEDAFSGTEEQLNEGGQENGVQRPDGIRTEGLPVGVRSGGQQERLRESGGGGGERIQQESGGTEKRTADGRGKASDNAQNGSVRPGLPGLVRNSRNYNTAGKDVLLPGTYTQRANANIAAIELALQLEQSGEDATPEQMSVLAQYTGWGGLGEVFGAYNAYGAHLRRLVGEDAYNAALNSTNYGFYTPIPVIDTLWNIARKLGFKGGSVLEGSAGKGDIIARIPKDMNGRSEITAIEIDPITGLILKHLNPDADVHIQGFEETRIPNGSVDLCVTNVPFGTNVHVFDNTGDIDLSRKFGNLHDFCIAKNVRKLADGGLGVFISTNGTLDNSKSLRDWVTSEGNADFIGAFRLNNETFVGTPVTSDIIVVRKRTEGKISPNAIDVSDVSTSRMVPYEENGKENLRAMTYNQYFVEHPENMGGEMRFGFEEGNTYRGTSRSCYPAENIDQAKRLKKFVNSLTGEEMREKATSAKSARGATRIPEGRKMGDMYYDGEKFQVVGRDGVYEPKMDTKKIRGVERKDVFSDYEKIKDALSAALAYQTENEASGGDTGLKPLLRKLNEAYDGFVRKYGHFVGKERNNSLAFLRNDMGYPEISSLEEYKEKTDEHGVTTGEYVKGDVFNGRVLQKHVEPHPDNVRDAVIASVFGRGNIDLGYISEALGKSVDEAREEVLSSGMGFVDVATNIVVPAYEYLSGNVRDKLEIARAFNDGGKYDANIKALEKVVPIDIPSHLIDVSLGSSIVPPSLYSDFIEEQTGMSVSPLQAGGAWMFDANLGQYSEKNRSAGVYSELSRGHITGLQLILAAMNNRGVRVTYKVGYGDDERTVVDKAATTACATKIDEYKDKFRDWLSGRMAADESIRTDIERTFNSTFNNNVPMEIPKEYIPDYFPGASHKWQMRPHQQQAIVRGTMQPLMIAHEVGTGKTFTLISTAMEMRRLGTARKPLIVVQNSTVGQFVNSAKTLYPNARILVYDRVTDGGEEGRRNFYAKIKYNDWDMIIIPQSTFDMIPDSAARQMAFIQERIDERIALATEMRKQGGKDANRMAVRMEKEVAKMEEELASISMGEMGASAKKRLSQAMQNASAKAKEMLNRKTDDVSDFDDMGIDAILVDEAHEYKHLGFSTAMQRGVKGVDPSYSKKSQGLYLKTRAVMEKSGGKNVIFATGTPISNTAAELWTFMRYLMSETDMKARGIFYFDDFVRNFGNIQDMLEFTTGGKFRENARFSGYTNLPELMRIWAAVCDTRLTEEMPEVVEKIPRMDNGEGKDEAQDIYLNQTRALRSVMKYVRGELERYERMDGSEKKENSDIPLRMYGIAKAAAIDARLVEDNAEDVGASVPGQEVDGELVGKDLDKANVSKTNVVVLKTFEALKATDEYKGTVAIFADNYRNSSSGFNLYEDIRNKLINGIRDPKNPDKMLFKGLSPDEVVVMRPNMSNEAKSKIFDKVNSGEVRVIIGSTYTLGVGVNIQERLNTLIHVDAPNRPMDYTQRNGRMLRQGNLHKEWDLPVHVLRFGVMDSLDVTAYQRLKTKGAIADSVMHGKELLKDPMRNRVLEEEEDVFGDPIAQLSGSEQALVKNQAERQVRKLEARRKQWESDQMYVHSAIPRLEGQIKDAERTVADNRKALEKVRKAAPEDRSINVSGKSYRDIDAMDDVLKAFNAKVKDSVERTKAGKWNNDDNHHTLDISIAGVKFTINVSLSAYVDYGETGRVGYAVTRKVSYDCPELGLYEVPAERQSVRNAVADIVNNVATGELFEERMGYAESRAERLRGELEQVRSREGKPFEERKELEAAMARLREATEAMKVEMAEKEKKYAEMDKEVDEARGVVATEEDSEDGGADEKLYRDGDDEDVTYGVEEKEASDGENEALRDAISGRVRDMVRELRLGDSVEIRENADGLTGRMAKSKGWYDPRTGKITIVLDNNADVADAEGTIMHEAVAHHGLRALLGKRFDSWLENVYRNVHKGARVEINALARSKGWDFRKATEEWLAGMSEDGKFLEAIRTGTWRKIRYSLNDLVRRLGFGVEMSDDEMRYALWRSYQNLKEGPESSLLARATDVAMQSRLRVGDFAPEEEPLLFRERRSAAAAVERDKTLTRDRYERRMHSGWYQSKEALQDSMRSLWEFYKLTRQAQGKKWKGIKDIKDFENAYWGENRLSSTNEDEINEMARRLFAPMYDEVRWLAPTRRGKEMLDAYMLCKHGLERNEHMAERNARLEYEKKRKESKNPGPEWDNLSEGERERRTAKKRGDYAGLTSLFPEAESFDELTGKAESVVRSYEERHNTESLWKRVNAVNAAILDKQLDSGIISRDVYDKIRGMYKYYIPLRGFEETTSDEAYAYVNPVQSAFNAPVKVARGRKSRADDPFANMEAMAESAVLQGNRNVLVKQRFYAFVKNNPTDLVSESELWLRYDKEKEGWEPVFPDLSGLETGAEISDAVKSFEERMERLAEENPEEYRKASDPADVPYRVLSERAMQEHQVLVKIGGKDIILTINGSPRLAQALNGKTNPDAEEKTMLGSAIRKMGGINRYLSQVYTTWNPDFIASNFMRDFMYSNTMVWAKESPRYAVSFNRNVARISLPRVLRLLDQRRRGTLPKDSKLARLFDEFMRNGGETGYARMTDSEALKRKIAKEIGGSMSSAAWRGTKAFGQAVAELGRATEINMRFVAYVTSREAGRSVGESVWDAKEISVNFNKKGAGDRFWRANGQTLAGNVASAVSAYGRAGIVFWNAGIQGVTNIGRVAYNHPWKFIGYVGAPMFVGGLLLAAMHGDDDDYWNIPDYVRRNNVCVRLNDGTYMRYPLTVEYRMMYGLGEILASRLRGKENEANMAMDIVGAISAAMPVDLMEGQNEDTMESWYKFLAVGLTPSAAKPVVEALSNRSWTGMPLYKETPWNGERPDWTKVYPNTGNGFVRMARAISRATGGDKYKKGWIDPNPAIWEYVLRGNFLGATFMNEVANTVQVIAGQKDFDWRHVPLMNRVLLKADEQTRDRSLTGEYMNFVKETGRTRDLYNRYLNSWERGEDDDDYESKVLEMENSAAFVRMEIGDEYKSAIKGLYDIANDESLGEEERKEARAAMIEAQKECLDMVKLYEETGDIEVVIEEMKARVSSER